MLYNVIPREEAPIPEWIGADHLSAESEEGREIVDLLSRLLEKDPLKRISLAEVKVCTSGLCNTCADCLIGTSMGSSQIDQSR